MSPGHCLVVWFILRTANAKIKFMRQVGNNKQDL